eukprot:10596586-Alexandrium_andersonii.AAC.1
MAAPGSRGGAAIPPAPRAVRSSMEPPPDVRLQPAPQWLELSPSATSHRGTSPGAAKPTLEPSR